MLQINGKTFMNLQEAVQWLLDNNALPFQSSANYIANTEIGLGTIVNPSPAKVRIGSLIFFADSKVSTVIGLTENGFICSDQYNNLVDDIAYVTNVSINASGHLITTLSDGQTIDAGQIKQVAGFSINGSQHLVVSYNDGTSEDLGAIFNGNVNITGDLAVSGLITGGEIVETMTGSSAGTISHGDGVNCNITPIYMGVVKTGNKITFVYYFSYERISNKGLQTLAQFIIPSAVGAKLYPDGDGVLAYQSVYGAITSQTGANTPMYLDKISNGMVSVAMSDVGLSNGNTYKIRFEQTFLLSDNLAS